MKKSALVLALILAIAAPIAAQMPPPPGGPPPELVLKEVLGLSEGTDRVSLLKLDYCE